MSRFSRHLEEHALSLCRGETTTLQINVGLLCNMRCRHCHLDAGPARREIMDRPTMEAVIALARGRDFATIDITGGAPEMNPHIETLLTAAAPLTPRLILRSNLTAVAAPARARLLELCRDLGVVVVASFPALNEAQVEAQRGSGAFALSLATLRRLNDMGYGQPESGLELNLVSNPAGAFLPGDQQALERRFRDVLQRRFGIVFNHLYAFANMPLGRFREWLAAAGNLEKYLDSLVDRFNPDAVGGLMCRELLSVGWDGLVYDCDFNLAAGMGVPGGPVHVRDVERLPGPGAPIAVDDHCFACTAGSGFT